MGTSRGEQGTGREEAGKEEGKGRKERKRRLAFVIIRPEMSWLIKCGAAGKMVLTYGLRRGRPQDTDNTGCFETADSGCPMTALASPAA